MSGLKNLLHPARFQGGNKKHRYFEGWYFKCVDEHATGLFAFIPGIALGRTPEDNHAFIQIIDGQSGRTAYYRFPLESFVSVKNEFAVTIGENRFSGAGLALRLKGGEIEAEGELAFHDAVRFPARGLSRGLMGPFLFIPAMECYHDAVSLTHRLTGRLVVDGRERDFGGGKGYIEKDWGRSFPSSWIWMQSNHFEDPAVSFMFSVARIPWLGLRFAGFMGFLRTPQKLRAFATYTGARVASLERDGDKVRLLIEDKNESLTITAERSGAGLLQAPVEGAMDRRIAESLTGVIGLELRSRRGGSLLFEGRGRNAGLEIMGDTGELAPRGK
jgi:tocopherol cyclase